MTLYPFETQLVLANNSTGVVVANASIGIYDPSDITRTSPLTLVDTNGIALPNPLVASPQGFIPAFQATVPQVMWSGGGYAGYLNSYRGLLDAALAAQAAAEAAALGATGGVPVGGVDGQYLGNIGGAPVWKALTGGSGGGGGSVNFVLQDVATGTIPARPTADSSILVLWICWTEPARVASGTGGAQGHDVWIRRAAP